MPLPNDQEIARDLTMKTLESGPAANVSLPYAVNYDGKKLGQFVTDLYATILAGVKAANNQ